ncbi:MAG: Stp1/IreP family PP2C-type Ser/Thr phosphatase [Bacteroidia bacterium]|nr:Stp1/IreP family PP2C-type Ser/Thr phosphatase [Bacteroidia bacterium]MDW8088760.1 Stp1/IreP family PP2C-type Ser/Thr phosphatase [Bacteroidia bacterium]
MGKPIGFRTAALSDRGRIRPNNEDRIAALRLPQGALWMVCDGMGGHAAGEKAAELAVQAVVEYLANAPPLPPPHLLEKALFEANHAIYTMAHLYPQYHRMGTTCVIALYREEEGKLYYAHIGDSRLYLYRQGQLYQKTLDHSYVQFLVSQGLLSPEEAELHPRRHVILRALGLSQRPEIEVALEALTIEPGDCILLCSDGLNNMLSNSDIQAILNTDLPLQAKAHALVKAANEAGGEDNISVVLAEFV